MLRLFFSFDRVFDGRTSSEAVYADAVAPLVRLGARGDTPACILMYGQTGSGKTYTMRAIHQLMTQELFGGVNPRRGVNDETWWFFGQDLTWSLVSSPEGQSPMARSMHGYDRLGSYLLIHGGVGPSKKTLNDMWSFHAGSSKWQEVAFPTADAPPGRAKHSMTVVNGRSNQPFLFVFGGISDEGTVNEKVYSDAWIFNLRMRPTEPGDALCAEGYKGPICGYE